MVLTQVKAGGTYAIHELSGEDATRRHLEGLGFIPGTQLTVVSRIGGNLIVTVKGSKLALDASLAQCIYV